MLVILQILFGLIRPWYWIQQESYNSELNNELLELLNSGEKFKDIKEYTATLGKYTLWIRNHPYASFTIYRRDTMGRPSRRTKSLLMKRYLESCTNL